MTAPAIGTRVRVHYNLQAAAKCEPAWIVTIGGIKVAAVDEIALSDCAPVYWQGRDGSNGKKPTGQWLSTHGGKRTVHAWIEGTVCAAPQGTRTEITYNPKRGTKFHERISGKVFQCAAYVHFTAAGAFTLVATNRAAVAAANAAGFTVNLSGNNVAHADALAALAIAPVVTVLPEAYGRKAKGDLWLETLPEYRARVAPLPKRTPAGRAI